jgi:cobalt/nickel transport system permease protein
LLTSIVGYGLYRATFGRSRGVRLAAAGVAAWLSVMTGALLTSLELWLSGTAKLDIVIPAMLGVHALIGLGEALITVAALAFILRSRPDLLGQGSASAQGGRGWILAGILVALGVVLLSPLASVDPDGLNRVAINLGFITTARTGSGPLAGYSIGLLGKSPLSRIAAGAIGLLVVLALAGLAGRALQRKS